MAEETPTAATPATPPSIVQAPPVEEPNFDEEVSIGDEFRGLYNDTNKIKDRWLRLAKTKEEEKDEVSAKLLRLIAGDVMPLISDMIAASGAGFEEMEEAMADNEEAQQNGGLTDEEVAQIYVTLLSNEAAFKQLVDQAGDENVKSGLQQLVDLNLTTMGMLRDTFGDEIAQVAADQIKEAAAG